jgi:hypothetical protein
MRDPVRVRVAKAGRSVARHNHANKSVVSVENASFAMCAPLAGPALGRAIKDRRRRHVKSARSAA